MFGQIKMVITVVLIAGLAGAGMYVMKLRSDNAILKANQHKLETAITEQNKVLEQQKQDFTAILERIVNGGGKNAARCIELASGAEHTEAELKATLKSEINPECPALANPSYVPYQ